MTTADDVVAYARGWIGTKWVHQGRSRAGVDCAGLLMMAVQEFGLEGADMLGYRREPGKAFLRHVKNHTDPVRPAHPVHGAIGIFNDTTMPCHTGIFAVDSKTGLVTVIHSEVFPRRCVHEQLYYEGNNPLAERLVDIRYFRGVDYV